MCAGGEPDNEVVLQAVSMCNRKDEAHKLSIQLSNPLSIQLSIPDGERPDLSTRARQNEAIRGAPSLFRILSHHTASLSAQPISCHKTDACENGPPYITSRDLFLWLCRTALSPRVPRGGPFGTIDEIALFFFPFFASVSGSSPFGPFIYPRRAFLQGAVFAAFFRARVIWPRRTAQRTKREPVRQRLRTVWMREGRERGRKEARKRESTSLLLLLLLRRCPWRRQRVAAVLFSPSANTAACVRPPRLCTTPALLRLPPKTQLVLPSCLFIDASCTHGCRSIDLFTHLTPRQKRAFALVPHSTPPHRPRPRQTPDQRNIPPSA